MTGNILKNLAKQLVDNKDAELLVLESDERLSTDQELDDYLDRLAVAHNSSHQNNHSSRPDIVEA
jgi:hypothetical protein